MEINISENVIQDFQDKHRPIITDLIYCQRGNIIFNSKDLVADCELEVCCECLIKKVTFEVKNG